MSAFAKYEELLQRIADRTLNAGDDQSAVDYWCSHYMALWDLCFGRRPRWRCVDGRAVER